jgi:hypothetical protein
MSKRRVLLVAVLLLVGLLLLTGVAVGWLAPRLVGLMTRPRTLSTPALLLQVQTVSELVTVKYIIEKVIVLEDVKWISGLGENRVLMVAHGIVKAGIDLSALQPGDLDVSGKKVRLRLPKARITEAYLDERQTRVIERTTGLLRMFDKDMEQNARQNAIDDIERAARNSGILKDAETRAQAQLTQLFKQLGFESIEFRK